MIREPAIAAGAFVLGLAAVYANPHTAHCDVRDELALEVARVAMNEAPGSAGDVRLIWEVVETSARTPEDRLAFLRRHSACASPAGDCDRDGDVDALDDEAARARPGNARWTRFLLAGDDEPDGWPSTWSWERLGRPTWARTREFARRLVFGLDRRRVCEEPPHTWAGRMDHARAARLGMLPVVCIGTENGGYRYASRLTS